MAVGYVCASDRHICSGAYSSMYTSAPGHIIDCSELI